MQEEQQRECHKVHHTKWKHHDQRRIKIRLDTTPRLHHVIRHCTVDTHIMENVVLRQ